ncbi:MAG: FKBP-type peptidyl-prolyl cis-trans isomerase, partial [Bacteroidota bacterium]
MKIDRNTVVILAYELRENFAEGRVVESIPEEKPLRFLYGAGVMLADFEINLYGKSEGDAFEFVVHHERGYGSFKEEAVLEVPKDVFRVDGKLAEDVLKIGTTIPMKDKNDKPMNG